jgi:hypothetical protein
MKPRMLAVLLTVIGVCSIGFYDGQALTSSKARASATTATAAPTPQTSVITEVVPPFAPQKSNIVASDVGGVIESITSE